MESEGQRFRSPEVKQVTERTYEQYVSKLHLPEAYLKNRGVIMDIGAGFTNFAQKVNERFGETGTKAYAVDPVYTFFDGDFEKFEKSLENSGLFLEFGYGRTSPKGKELDEIIQEMKKLYDEFCREATESGSYIVGSHQNLPFKNESADLVVGNNSILRFNNREIAIRALNEVIRVLKQDGEARIGPTYFDWDKEHNELALVKYGTMTKQDFEDQERTGKLVDMAMFRAFKVMESLGGIKFYVGIDKYNETEQTLVQNLILRKDKEIPIMNVDDPYFHELRKINFADSEDQFFIPSKIIDLRKDKE